jgi:hypothetical protein
MNRYRRQLTRPEIARLAAETTVLRRELQELVAPRKKPKTARMAAESQPASGRADDTFEPPAGAPRASRGARKRR